MAGSTELHATPGVGASLRSQAWLLAVSGRWLAFTGSLLVLVGFMAALLPPERLSFWDVWLGVLAVLALPAAALWVIVVWQGENPKRRSYHWSLPVPRPAHDRARVLIGGAGLVAALGAVALVLLIASVVTGHTAVLARAGASVWISLFCGPLVIYLLVTPPVLWSDYRVTKVLVGALMVIGFLAAPLDALGFRLFTAVLEGLFATRTWGLGTAVLDGLTSMNMGGITPDETTRLWWRAALLWGGIGVAGTAFATAFRPDDLRRRLTRR